MPPPNATGSLHLGHALSLTIQDVVVRWMRMKGRDVVWVPGFDHAPTAVLRSLLEDGALTAQQISAPSPELEGTLAQAVDVSRASMRRQAQRLGLACDWDREQFTLDPEMGELVRSVLHRMNSEGLLYRARKIINWDVDLQTTLPDDEVESERVDATILEVDYGPLRLSTSRPELRLGDTAIAVHPSDARWTAFVGRRIEVRWPGVTFHVTVVADEGVRSAENGPLPICPGHDAPSLELAAKHELDVKLVIGVDGRMTELAGPYAGLSMRECRERLTADLCAAGIARPGERCSIGELVSTRSGKPVVRMAQPQWFLKVKKPCIESGGESIGLAAALERIVAKGEVDIAPAGHRKTILEWAAHPHDWCISRQLPYGHRVPFASTPDTLDSWFSAALLAVRMAQRSERGNGGAPLAEARPRMPLLVTGRDLAFFWVGRMIMLSSYVLGYVPFRSVYLHGLLTDGTGRKMSTSRRANAVPIDSLLARHGADALRFCLLWQGRTHNDSTFKAEHLNQARRLERELFHAGKKIAAPSRDGAARVGREADVHGLNAWMLCELADVVERTEERLEQWKLGTAAEELLQSFRRRFYRFFLRAAATHPFGELAETRRVLRVAIQTYLRAFHPFVPFVTEHVWQGMGFEGQAAHASWPSRRELSPRARAPQGIDAVLACKELVNGLRREVGIDRDEELVVRVASCEFESSFEECRAILAALTRSSVSVVPTAALLRADRTYTYVDLGFRVQIALAARLPERERLLGQLAKIRRRFEAVSTSLRDPRFARAASADVRQRYEESFELLENAKAFIEGWLGLAAT